MDPRKQSPSTAIDSLLVELAAQDAQDLLDHAAGPPPQVAYRRLEGRVFRCVWDDAVKEWIPA